MTTPLPPLPDGKLGAEEFMCGAPAYTAEQMTAYGQQVAKAERKAALLEAIKHCRAYVWADDVKQKLEAMLRAEAEKIK